MHRYLRITAVGIALLCMLGLGNPPAEAAKLNLHRGSRGSTVQILESRLYKLHLLPRGQVDRRYRAATVRAVKRFQRQQHLRATGRVNLHTWNLVSAELRRRTAPKPKPKPKPTAVPVAPAPPAPTILGHRGARVPGIPENTMASLRYATGASDVLEFDLQLTSDHEFVLMHDTTLDRTTNCAGQVATWTLQELQTSCLVDLNASSAPAERIPTFAQAAEYAAGVSRAIAPEVKDDSLTAEDVTKFLAVVNQYGLMGRTFVQSFDKPILQRLKLTEPQLTFVYLVASTVAPQDVVDSGATIAGVNLTGLSAAQVAAFKAAGLRVWAWTASSTTQLKSLWDLRVDGVITDIPASARSMYYPG